MTTIYRANEFIATEQDLLDKLAAYETFKTSEIFGAVEPRIDAKTLEIYENGKPWDYEFTAETWEAYSLRVQVQAALDLEAEDYQPYIDDPQLWLDAILRPRRLKLFMRYDFWQGACCWDTLTEIQKNEYRAWRSAMCDLPNKYPTFVDPATIEWPSFSFMEGC